MTENELIFLKNWFSTYTQSFYSSNMEDQKNIMLKVEHAYKVCKNIIEIAKDLSLNDNEKRLAETIALFHDIGRFLQYAKYKTFKDSISVNHGFLGARILLAEKIFQSLHGNEQRLITQVVKFHNASKIPDTQDRDTIFFLKLIRDADKLDIWRVFIEYYESDEKDRASAAAHGLPDIPEYSEDVLCCLPKKQIASISNVKTLNDFKLMQLSWVYDLNFKASFKLLLERDYINRIVAKLPKTDEISNALQVPLEYIRQRLNSISPGKSKILQGV